MKRFLTKYKNIIIGVICLLVLAYSLFIDESSISPSQKNVPSCTVSISYEDILKNTDTLSEAKKDILKKDGVLLKPTEVYFVTGESAFDVLQRITKENKIHMDFSKTSASDSAYIKGIGNIYEKDCGDMSGWTYLVNGQSLNVSSSQYEIKDGDQIQWVYLCDITSLWE